MPKTAPRNIKDSKTTQELVEEYLKRGAVLDEAMATIREDKKALKEEFKDRIDLKVLAKAQRVVRARASVEEKDEAAFQEMLDLMEADLTLRTALRQAS